MDHSLRLRARMGHDAIASGGLRGEALLQLLRSVPVGDRDLWVDELLGFDEAPPDVPDLPRGCVPYLPCGVDEIVAMVREAPVRANEVLVDLGAGLGRVAILVHLLTGAEARGVEIQEPLVRVARGRSLALNLPGVSFVHANAADIVPEGTVFFLYSPFNGEMLRAVLRRIEDAARKRAIVVGTVGLELRDVTWLSPRETTRPSLAIYDSEVFHQRSTR